MGGGGLAPAERLASVDRKSSQRIAKSAAKPLGLAIQREQIAITESGVC